MRDGFHIVHGAWTVSVYVWNIVKSSIEDCRWYYVYWCKTQEPLYWKWTPKYLKYFICSNFVTTHRPSTGTPTPGKYYIFFPKFSRSLFNFKYSRNLFNKRLRPNFVREIITAWSAYNRRGTKVEPSLGLCPSTKARVGS